MEPALSRLLVECSTVVFVIEVLFVFRRRFEGVVVGFDRGRSLMTTSPRRWSAQISRSATPCRDVPAAQSRAMPGWSLVIDPARHVIPPDPGWFSQ